MAAAAGIAPSIKDNLARCTAGINTAENARARARRSSQKERSTMYQRAHQRTVINGLPVLAARNGRPTSAMGTVRAATRKKRSAAAVAAREE